MGADIVNIVDGKFSGRSFIHLPAGDWAALRAEIVRLRGEVKKLAAAVPVPRDPKAHQWNGVGMIGGHRGQTPDSFEQWAEDCPDCTPQPAGGEAVEFVAVPDDYRNQASGYRAGWTDAMNAAPVQAAPQEGEGPWLGEALRFLGELESVGNLRAGEVARGLRRHAAHPSACELGADGWRIEVRPDNRDGVLGVWATKDGVSYWLAAASADAALQHRGDSRGGEG